MTAIIHSMTGFGRCTAVRDGRKITVELKSVNHRNLDLGIRLYRTVSFLEEGIRAALSARLVRGHIDVYLNYINERDDHKQVTADIPLARAYAAAIRELSATLGARGRLKVDTLAGLPDVLRVTEADEDEEALRALAAEALGGALTELIEMRSREGERLRADLTERLDSMERLAAQAASRAPAVVADYRDRLKARVAELLAGAQADESRLATEVALFADRASIDEELVRLMSHIGQARRLLDDCEPVGRKLDFLVQELNREVNTLCSKANDIEITNIGLSLKNEIEKIREQVQNIE
ncbi:MAG: YicC family protein [Clostridiales bacterium]|nr:YicC family protein [Clostridiales bacterium]